jgi:hypothetical protein
MIELRLGMRQENGPITQETLTSKEQKLGAAVEEAERSCDNLASCIVKPPHYQTGNREEEFRCQLSQIRGRRINE